MYGKKKYSPEASGINCFTPGTAKTLRNVKANKIDKNDFFIKTPIKTFFKFGPPN